MTDKLPPPLLALFQPRPPLRYLPPGDRAPEDCGKSTISGVAQFLADAKSHADEVPYNATESWIQRKYRQKIEKKEQQELQVTEGLQNCMNPPDLIPYLFQLANIYLALQSTLKMTLKLEVIHSRRSLSRASVMMSKKPT